MFFVGAVKVFLVMCFGGFFAMGVETPDIAAAAKRGNSSLVRDPVRSFAVF